jgi:hypothetical protein
VRALVAGCGNVPLLSHLGGFIGCSIADRVKFIPHKRFSNSFDPKVSIYKVSALVSALEFGDYRTLSWVIFSKDRGRS